MRVAFDVFAPVFACSCRTGKRQIFHLQAGQMRKRRAIFKIMNPLNAFQTRKRQPGRALLLCFQEQIQGPENASIARFDGPGRY